MYMVFERRARKVRLDDERQLRGWMLNYSLANWGSRVSIASHAISEIFSTNINRQVSR